MADSIRELIFQNIKSCLQGIRQKDGYEYNVDKENVLIIHGKLDDSAYAEPLIYIYPGSESLVDENCEKGKDYNELDVQIEAFIRGSRETMNTNINKMLSDIKKALGADHTRGGYAINTQFMSNDAFLVDLTGEKCGIVMTLLIGYEHNYGDPFEQ